MIETVLAVLALTFVFVVLFCLSHMLTGKIMVEHAAMRVARARTVGLNRFMCEKAARVAVIPVAGRRLWPEGDELDHAMELSRIPIYMGTPNGAVANGVLEYEGWHRLEVEPGDGTAAETRLGFSLFGEDGPGRAVAYSLEGKAETEENYRLYLTDMGL